MYETGRANRLGVYLPLKVSHSPLVWRQKSNYGQFFYTFPSGCRVRFISIILFIFLSGQKKTEGAMPETPKHLFGHF